jgi:hypothetical protein
MAVPRNSEAATLLNDGTVLITGGLPDLSTIISGAEVLDLTAGTSTSTGSMATARAWHTATRLNDGRVLVTGGDSNTTIDLSSAEIYH